MASQTPQHVLVVDDEAPIRRLAERVLGRLGHSCTSAASVAEARDALGDPSAAFTLILADVRLPDRPGPTAGMLRIEQRRHGAWCPIVTISGALSDVEADELELADDVLAKPFTPADVAALMATWNAPGPVAPHGLSDAFLDDLADQLGGSEAVKEILDLLLEGLGERAHGIASAIRRGDHDQLRELAHALKGSAASLGAAGLTEACLALETCGRDRALAVAPEALRLLAAEIDRVRSDALAWAARPGA